VKVRLLEEFLATSKLLPPKKIDFPSFFGNPLDILQTFVYFRPRLTQFKAASFRLAIIWRTVFCCQNGDSRHLNAVYDVQKIRRLT
jgi:hypothetical protein